jgi:hypothetical protein
VTKRRWITGEEILERWQAAPFELVDAMRLGGLVAEDPDSGKRFVPSSCVSGGEEDCFFCSKPVQWAQVCYKVKGPEAEEYTPVFCEDLRPDLSEANRTQERITKALGASFRLSNVEAYEQAHGLGPLPHKPETAEALAETLRATGITDAGMIARMVMAAFPMKERELGALMRGEPDDDSHKAGNVKAARRLLDKE